VPALGSLTSLPSARSRPGGGWPLDGSIFAEQLPKNNQLRRLPTRKGDQGESAPKLRWKRGPCRHSTAKSGLSERHAETADSRKL
jgi:hypothetical protein